MHKFGDECVLQKENGLNLVCQMSHGQRQHALEDGKVLDVRRCDHNVKLHPCIVFTLVCDCNVKRCRDRAL